MVINIIRLRRGRPVRITQVAENEFVASRVGKPGSESGASANMALGKLLLAEEKSTNHRGDEVVVTKRWGDYHAHRPSKGRGVWGAGATPAAAERDFLRTEDSLSDLRVA